MFKLSKSYNNPKHSKLTRIKNRVKFLTYSIMHELLQCQFSSSSLQNFLLLVEAGQFLWYAIHPDFPFLWQTSFAQYPRDIVKYLQVDALFRQGDRSFYYTVLYIFAASMLGLFMCVTFIVVKFDVVMKKSSTVIYYLLRLLSLCALLLITIGPIPVFHTFFEAITCDKDDNLDNDSKCYTGIHLVNTIIGSFGLTLATIFTFTSQLLFIDFNPASNIPFAGPQSIIGFYKLAMKIGLPLYITLDSDLSTAKGFVIFYAIAWFFALVLRYISRGYYNESVNTMTTVTESIVTWAAITAVFHAHLDVGQVDDIGLYFFLVISPFVAYSYNFLVTNQRWREMRINVRKAQKVYQIERFINTACFIIENKEKPQGRIELEGLLRYHTKVCKKDINDCLCHTLGQNIANTLDSSGEEEKIWYRFVDSLMADSIAKFPKNSRLHLQNAYFQQDSPK